MSTPLGLRRSLAKSRCAFTLIELLVVVAIIAILIAVLLPALSAARRHSQAIKCAANLHHVGQAMASYLSDSGGIYPPAYIYPYDSGTNYDLNRQEDQGSTDPTYGYMHWSWFLYSNGQADDSAFSCPSIKNGGSPRTNPGLSGWESEQVDQNGQNGPNAFQDRQAPRVAFAGNAAIFPRNKFTNAMSGGPRVNICVNEKSFNSGKTILCAEVSKNWKATAINEGGGWKSKSHRPINPFIHLGSGTDEYGSPPETPGFTYGNGPDYGLVSAKLHETLTGVVEGASVVETNAVGRHHPGGDKLGGTANFLYADGHTERKAGLETVRNWEWGNKFFSVSGNTKIGPPW